MTNADCIRRMSDEQLFEFLSEWECGDIDYSVTFCDLCNEATKRGEAGNALNLDCDGCRRYWLQRDAVDYGGLMYWKRNTTFEADTPQTDCETCKHDKEEWYSDACYSCCKAHSNYEPQTDLVKDSDGLVKDLVKSDCPWK